MSDIIGAEAAKLAGLQIDMLGKYRQGKLTLGQFEWFLGLSREERSKLSGITSPSKKLNLKKFLIWLERNDLDGKLSGGLMIQIAEQEIFYRRFYGDNFRIDLKKISIDPSRLPAIKAGLKAGSINYVLVKAVPLIGPMGLSAAETRMTGARFFFERLMKPLKSDGFKVWAETGTDRWTKLTLIELLGRGIPVESEELNADAFKKDWVTEITRLIGLKRPPWVIPGMVDIVFTINAQDIPADQTIVNKDGQIVKPRDRSYVSAIEQKVRALSHEEGIILAAQLFAKDKTYLAPNTWEWRRDIIDHRDKGTSPGVSVGVAGSGDSELNLNSNDADNSNSNSRLRLALALRAFCF